MNAKFRAIEVDETTAALLEARAAARNLTVAELLADLAASEAGLPADLAEQRATGTGPWSPEVLAEDERRLLAFREERSGADWSDVRDWMESWGRPSEGPAPKARKL